MGETSGTKAAILRKNIITAYRKKAKGELPELVELIRSERKGGATILRSQARSNRELFPAGAGPRTARPRRTFEDLLK